MPALFRAEKWSVLQTHGLIQVNSTYITTRKPPGTVLMRIALLLVMFAGAMLLIALPLSLCLAAWEATLAAIGLVLIYGGVSFFLRPQVDAENQGWRGGAKAIDSAPLHRFLVVLHWLSAPGRFAAESLLDVCVLLGLAGGAEIGEEKTLSGPIPLDPAPNAQEYWQG
jgi:hypothetical protein